MLGSAAGACWLALLVALPAQAHEAPQIRKLAWSPASSEVLLQTNRGLIFGDPATKKWRLLCNEAMHINSAESPGVAYLQDGTVLVATSGGLRSTRDHGCSWSVAFEGLLVPALVQDGEQPERLFIATFPRGEASENVGGDSTIRFSADGGASWKIVSEMRDNDFVNALRLAPSDDQRVYASGTVYGADGRVFYVARSDDLGGVWQRFPVPLSGDDDGLQLLAVSPGDPDLVLAKVTPSDPILSPERLLISRDGGQSFGEAAKIMNLRDAAFSADGKTLWLASKEGLHRSLDGGVQFERIGVSEELSCAVAHADNLLACGWYLGFDGGARSNGVGRSPDRGDSFQPWMTFQEVTEPVACLDGTPTHALCETPFRDWRYELDNMFSPDALARDGGAPPQPASDAGPTRDAGPSRDAGADPSPPPDSGAQPTPGSDGGCSVHAGPGVSAWWPLVTLALLLRRRRAA